MHVRILIAEDEKDLNQILTSRLKAEHYSVDSHSFAVTYVRL